MNALLIFVLTLLPMSVSAAEVPLQAGVDTLTCEDSEFIVTSICTATGPVRCESQSMTMTTLGSFSPPKAVPLARDTDHTLATTLLGWACVTSPSNNKYVLLEYRCDDRFPSCTDELQQREFSQIVDLSGRNLDEGHKLISRANAEVLRQTGIEGLMKPPGLDMVRLKYGRPARTHATN